MHFRWSLCTWLSTIWLCWIQWIPLCLSYLEFVEIWVCWIWSLIFKNHIWIVLAISFSNIFSAPLFLLLLDLGISSLLILLPSQICCWAPLMNFSLPLLHFWNPEFSFLLIISISVDILHLVSHCLHSFLLFFYIWVLSVLWFITAILII